MANLKRDNTPHGDEVVISGISGQFPSAVNIDEFREKLFRKEDLTQDREDILWQNQKFDVPKRGGVISDINKFDAGFYGMPAGVVNSCDPLCRKMLEKVFEAIVDAGLNPRELAGTNTAVFTGSFLSDFESVISSMQHGLNHIVMGISRAFLCNRISYFLDIHGTSISIISPETCGLEALTAAYEEIKFGRCDAALVCAVSISMAPQMAYHFKELGLLSKSGKSNPFDAEADGFLLSGGVVALFLQRAQDAKRIYATIVNSETRHCGDHSGKYISQCGDAFADLLEKFYDKCGVDPAEIVYLEAEGTGVKAFDDEEMKAIDKILLKNRKTPLLIGSVKSNMGHGQGASTLCGLAKVLIAMQEGAIPPNLNFEKPSPSNHALIDNKAKIVTEVTPWNGGFMAINSMSLCGSHGHILLKSFEKEKSVNNSSDELPHLIIASSRTEHGMQEMLHELQSMPIDCEFIGLLHNIHSSNINNHMYRGYTLLLQSKKPIAEIKHYDQTNRPVWFVFSGMGSQWIAMGKELMQLNVCAAAIDNCHLILMEKGIDLKHIITTTDPSIYDNILHCFVGIAAIQIALVDMLNILGIKPDGMVGHSVGELGCAYADGCLSLEETILSAYYRGKASLQAELIPGFMAAIGLGYNQIKSMLPPEIDVACHNSASSSTISGPADLVKQFVSELQARNIFARAVNVANIAYHSRYIQPAAPFLLESLQKVISNPKRRSDKWVCSSVPEEKWDHLLAQYCSAEYLTNNLLSPVLFEEASKHIPKNAIVIEIAPHGLLQAILRRSLNDGCININLVQRGQGVSFTLSVIGKLYCAGLTPQVRELYPPVQFPVSRGTPSISSLVKWDHSHSWLILTDLKDFVPKKTSGAKIIDINLNEEDFRAYKNHVVNGSILFPAFGYLKILWETFATLKDPDIDLRMLPVVFEDVKIFSQLQIERTNSYELDVLVQQGSGLFEVSYENQILVTGKVTPLDSKTNSFIQQIPVQLEGIALPGDYVYKELEMQGYEYSGNFKGINKIRVNREGCVAGVQWAEDWVAFGQVLLQLMMIQSSEHRRELKIPKSFKRIMIDLSKFPTDTQEMEAVYNRAMNVIQCGGMEFQNVKFSSFSSVKSKNCNQLMQTVKFVSYNNLLLQNLEQFIAVCLQCVIENSYDGNVSIAVNNSSVADAIELLIPYYPQARLNVKTAYMKKSGESYDLVVVTKADDLEAGISLLRNNGGFLLACVQNNSWQIKSNLIVITKQEFANTKMVLLRKTEPQNSQFSEILHLNGKVSTTWLQDIKKTGHCHRLYAVAQIEEQGLEIVSNFIQQVNAKLGLHHVRYIFILDKKAPKFSLTENIYYKHLNEKDLVQNVYSNGDWGTFCFIPLDIIASSKSCGLDLPFCPSLNAVSLSYLGLSQKDMLSFDIKKNEFELGPLDFSGHLKSGQRVMGIAMLDDKTKNLSSDTQLIWEVPESWSLQDAATVPFAYTITYHALVLKANLKVGECVLIHAGWTSIGQAAITLALSFGCTIYTTISNHNQRIFIKHRFPQLLDDHIFSCEDEYFETYILRKSTWKGVDVIFNCYSDFILQTSLRCLASFGRFIQFGQLDVNNNETIGMNMFLRNVKVYGVSPQNIFTLSCAWKQVLSTGVQNMIEKGVIKPLQYNVFSLKQAQETLEYFADINETMKILISMKSSENKLIQQNKFLCDSQNYYIVIGSELELCVDVVDWLTLQGAHNMAIVIGSNNVSGHIEERIKLLCSYHNVNVVLIRADIGSTTTEVTKFLQKTSSLFMGSLKGIFILPLESPEQEDSLTSLTISSLDVATRGIDTLAYFVCLLMKNSWSVCERRQKEGFPAFSVFWTNYTCKHFNWRQSLKSLNTIFTSKINCPVLLVTENKIGLGREVQDDLSLLTTFLPNSLDAVVSLGEDLVSDTSLLVEVPSLSPGYGKVKDVPPVFLIPGLQGSPTEYLKPLIRKMMYPVLCARIVQPKNTVKVTASALVKSIQMMQHEGPYNLVGISWGGAVTLEVAKLLETEGHQTRIVLVDGAPETIQAAVQQLNVEDHLDTELLSLLLQTKIDHETYETCDWSELLNKVLEEQPSSIVPKMKTSLTMLYNCLTILLDFKHTGQLINGEVSLLRPSGGNKNDNCGLDHDTCSKMVSLKTGYMPDENDIVISGISGQFPESKNIDEFCEKLFNKEDLLTTRTHEFWINSGVDVPLKTGYISDLDKFDTVFYGMHAKVAESCDAYCRKLLEKVFEAIVDAGINPGDISRTNTAVFTGSIISESENILAHSFEKYKYGMLGHCRAMLSNRISYWLDVIGSSVSITTLETCGFEALTAAYEEMKRGRCDSAVVGAVNIVYTPNMCHSYKEFGFLSNSGKCNPFDAEADGYLQSSGVMAILLQKAKVAKRIYATVVKSDVSHCGDRSGHLVTPYGDPLADLMETFYKSCEVDPSEIVYLETEGVGVKNFDEEEMKAVDKVLTKNRKTPLLIGSVKSNMGHGHGVSNLCSVAKVLIAMEKRAIPPNIHFSKPSPNIPALIENRVKVITDVTPWNGGLVALNSMSICGTYAHVLLKSFEKEKPKNTHIDGLPRLVVVSSRIESGLEEILNKLDSMPVDIEFIRLLHDVHSSNINKHMYRGYTILPSLDKPVHEIQYYDQTSLPVWFVFSGMGSQWNSMGVDLMKLPICGAAIEKCHTILAEKGVDLKHIITTDDPSVYDNILHSFVGIAAIQIALVDMLHALGIKPDGMVGHSVGELGCAYADGCLSLEEMILSAYYRGQASLQAELIPGFMAAIGLGYNQIKSMLPPEIDIACHNSASSSTISGPADLVKQFVSELQKHRIFARAINVANIAYHSRYIQPAAPFLLEFLQSLVQNPKKRSDRWICSSLPEEKWDTPLAQYCSAEYLTNNLLSPVLFEEASRHIPKNAIAIEIAPHGLLQAILRRSLDAGCINVPLTQRGQGLLFTLTAIGKLYCAGLSPQVKELYPPVQLPVSRGTPSISPLVRWDHTISHLIVPDLLKSVKKRNSGEKYVQFNLNKEEFRAYADYTVDGRILFPAFGYLKLIWEILAGIRSPSITNMPVMFEDVNFFNQLQIEKKESYMIYVLLQQGSGYFEISHEDVLLVTGRVTSLDSVSLKFFGEIPIPSGDIELSGDTVYAQMEQNYKYNGLFRGIEKLSIGRQGCIAKVKRIEDWVVFGEVLLQLVTIYSSVYSQGQKFPGRVQRIIFDPSKYRTQGPEMEAVYNHAMNTISCGGMEVNNIRLNSFNLLKNPNNIVMKKFEFVSYPSLKLKNIQEFIAFTMQCAAENSIDPVASVAVIDTSIMSIIESLLPYYPQIKLNIETQYMKSGKSHDLVIVTKNQELESGISIINNTGGFLLVQIKNKSWQVKSDLIMMGEQEFDNVKFLLFRKAESKKENTPYVLHLSANMSTWLQQIKKVESYHHLYVVAQLESQEMETVSCFMQQTNGKLRHEHIRYVFILDKEAPRFSLTESLYQKHLNEKDLTLNVYYNGEWGTFCFLPVVSTNNNESELPINTSLEAINMNFLGLNHRDMSLYDSRTLIQTEKVALGAVDYSGYVKNGHRVMGVAMLDQVTQTLSSYPYLMWEIPKSWSMEEAATVPLAYTVAYYALVIKGKLKCGESILVHAGCSNIGQAAIALALHYKCTVYTTVGNEEQKTFLKQEFPQLLDEHIFSYNDIGFELYILQHCIGTTVELLVLNKRKGKGVNVILNCFSGVLLHASVRCLAPFGRFLQLLEPHIITNQTIGMEVFAKSAVMCGISTQNLVTLTPEWKEALHVGVQDLIYNGVIKPLHHVTFTKQQTEEALRSFADISKPMKVIISLERSTNETMPKKNSFCSSQSFYLIFGSAVDDCLNVADWLALQGVRQIAVVVKNKSIQKYTEQRIELLHLCHNVRVIILEACVTSPSQLIEKASSMFTSFLEGVFILPQEPGEHENNSSPLIVESLDDATRGINTLKHFVCLFVRNSWSVCERRHKEGFPALSVFWNQYTHTDINYLRECLKRLSGIIATKINSPILLLENEVEEVILDVTLSLDLFLPNSMDAVINLGKDLESDSSWLVEMPSLSPGYGKVKDVPPVFLIPGLQGSPTEYLKPFGRKIMYPVLCARIVQPKNTLTDTAAVLIKYIQKSQNKGPYNLVGISWGGAITLELARLLEAEGHETRVLLVDGAPETTQAAAQQLHKDGNWETNLVSTLLQTKVKFNTSHNWSELLREALSSVPSALHSHLTTALVALRNYLTLLLDYKPSGELLEGEMSLIRPSASSEDDNCGLDNFCKRTVNMHVVEGNHETLLWNPETTRIINDFIL